MNFFGQESFSWETRSAYNYCEFNTLTFPQASILDFASVEVLQSVDTEVAKTSVQLYKIAQLCQVSFSCPEQL